MSGSIVEPHDKMRARDVNKVARGEQAPRPPHEPGKTSKAPPPTSVKAPEDKLKERSKDDRLQQCDSHYLEYLRCLEEKGDGAPECDKLARYCRSICPPERIEKWNQERKRGVVPRPV